MLCKNIDFHVEDIGDGFNRVEWSHEDDKTSSIFFFFFLFESDICLRDECERLQTGLEYLPKL